VYLAGYIIFADKRITRDYVIASTDESWTFLSVITGFFYF